LAGLTLTSTWCLLGTFKAFGLLKSKEGLQSFNLRKLITVGWLPTAKKFKKKDFAYDIYANQPTAIITLLIFTFSPNGLPIKRLIEESRGLIRYEMFGLKGI